jgi:hypothetical protein
MKEEHRRSAAGALDEDGPAGREFDAFDDRSPPLVSKIARLSRSGAARRKSRSRRFPARGR